MKETTFLFKGACLVLIVFFAMACNNNVEKKAEPVVAKDSSKVEKEPAPIVTKRAPVINIGDTVSLKRIVLTMKDSAATMERISIKLAEIYGVSLAAVISKNKLKVTGRPMAWYKSQKAPYFFEAGIPVDKRPAKLAQGVMIKEIGIDSVVVAHFYGPYDLTSQAYDVLKELLKDRKKKLKGAPYEIYVDDPFDGAGRPKDPYKVLTDVVFPWK